MSDITSQYVITLKLTTAQHDWLAATANTLAEISGHPVAHSAVIMRLMELGAPLLMENLDQKKNNKSHIPTLRLIKKD
jgi:hypothetical protein